MIPFSCGGDHVQVRDLGQDMGTVLMTTTVQWKQTTPWQIFSKIFKFTVKVLNFLPIVWETEGFLNPYQIFTNDVQWQWCPWHDIVHCKHTVQLCTLHRPGFRVKVSKYLRQLLYNTLHILDRTHIRPGTTYTTCCPIMIITWRRKVFWFSCFWTWTIEHSHSLVMFHTQSASALCK